MRYKIQIPVVYVNLTKGSKDRVRLFKKYVLGYLKKTYPEMELIKIEGMYAVCESRTRLATAETEEGRSENGKSSSRKRARKDSK